MNWPDAALRGFAGSFRSIFAEARRCFPNLAIDARRLLRGQIDQLRPAPAGFIRACLTQQVGRLQNGFERVAEVMRQHAQFCDVILFLAVVATRGQRFWFFGMIPSISGCGLAAGILRMRLLPEASLTASTRLVE